MFSAVFFGGIGVPNQRSYTGWISRPTMSRFISSSTTCLNSGSAFDSMTASGSTVRNLPTTLSRDGSSRPARSP